MTLFILSKQNINFLQKSSIENKKFGHFKQTSLHTAAAGSLFFIAVSYTPLSVSVLNWYG